MKKSDEIFYTFRKPSVADKLSDSTAHILRSIESRYGQLRREIAGVREVAPFCKLIRGQRALQGRTLNAATKAADIMFVRTLDSESGSGANLVPTEFSESIIELTQNYSALLASGPRIWPFPEKMRKANIVDATAGMSVSYQPTDSTGFTLTDPGLGSLSFNLKMRGTLTQIPNELLAVSHPRADLFVGEMIAKAFAADFDAAFFGATQVSNGPLNLLSSSKITTLTQAGASFAFPDLQALMSSVLTSRLVKTGPFAFFCSPATFVNILLPLAIAAPSNEYPAIRLDVTNAGDGNSGVLHFRLMGFDLYITPGIPNNMGASSNASYLAFGNPSHSFNLVDHGYSLESSENGPSFDKNSTYVRSTNLWDITVSEGFSVLTGVK